MGNSPNAGTGGWFFSEEATLVQLRLHDVRWVGLASGEEVAGAISLGPGGPSVACVRRDEAASVPVRMGTTLAVEFQAVQAGKEVGNGRFLGSVTLPLEHIARRCGGSLYHMWLPLETSPPLMRGAAGNVAKSPQGPQQGSDPNTLESFDRALRMAARDPRLPLTCLSLCQANSPQAEKERYEFHAEAAEKSQRFCGLLQSHAQHSRLLQALYRQSRSGRLPAPEVDKPSQMLPQLRDALVDSWASLAQARNFQAFARHEGFSPDVDGTASDGLSRRAAGMDTPVPSGLIDPNSAGMEDASRLRLDIETTTKEANTRINQASEAIRTLKDRLATKQAEHERLRKETARVRRDADALENENEQLRLQLERHARERDSPGDRNVEIRRLQREAEVLGDQKQALVLILEDLYGAIGQQGGKGAPGHAEAAPLPEVAEPQVESFQHLLPRPSELFASGVLEEQQE